MSQQHEMEFADPHADGPEAAYRGYSGPAYQDYEVGAYHREQESPQLAIKPDGDLGINPTFMMQMRLGLLIVSLSLWVIVFFGSIWVLAKISPDLAPTVDPLVFFGLVAFTVLTALGNFFFGRRR